MNKQLIIAAIAALSLGACTSKNSNTGDELVMATHAAYPPYESVDAHGEIVGFDIDVARAVAAKLGKKLVIQNMSFDGLILGLKQHKFDIIMAGISITQAREREIALVPYQGDAVTSFTLLFWHNVPTDVKSPVDLKNVGNKTIAVQTGTTMENHLSSVSGITPKALDGTVELIMDIKHGKSIAALVEPHIATSLVAQHAELRRVDFSLPREEWVLGNGVGVAKDNVKLLTNVQHAIQTLKKDGVISALEEKWLRKS